MALNSYRVVTDGQTDRQTDRIPIANTRSQQYLPVQLWRVKTHTITEATKIVEDEVRGELVSTDIKLIKIFVGFRCIGHCQVVLRH